MRALENPKLLTPIALALVVSTFIAAVTVVFLRTRDVRSIEVTGSAKRRIVSDLIEWEATVQAHAADRIAAVTQLKAGVDKTRAYLLGAGVTADEIRVGSASVDEQFEQRVEGSGDDRVERSVPTGFRAHQNITIRSTDVTKIERVSREVTSLLEQGLDLSSERPAYFYTRLADLKIEMLAEASRDARTRAEQMVAAAGGEGIGKLTAADMGVINVNSANSTETSWQGNNDTSSLEKDILAIVHITFELR